jgi:hypothetical protein
MNFKSKNDLGYFKFLEVMEIVGENIDDSYFLLEEMFKAFKPKSINELEAAMEKVCPIKFKFKLDLNFKTAGAFIDADTYFSEADTLNLFKIILKPKRKYIFFRHKQEDISLAEAEYALTKWKAFLDEIKFQYEYIYNPPVRIQDTNASSQKQIEVQAFMEHYGGYMEIVYLLTGGYLIDSDSVFEWELHRFLFQGEYLLRKKDVENLK